MQSAANKIMTIVCNEIDELIKNTTAIEALCQSLSCANAPSCSHRKL